MVDDKLKISGKVIAILPLKEGISQKGEWASQDYVIETEGNFSKKICFNVFGQDKIDKYAIKIGDMLNVCFNISSKEFNGKWYTTINAWSIRNKSNEAYQQNDTSKKDDYNNNEQDQNKASIIDDLPF